MSTLDQREATSPNPGDLARDEPQRDGGVRLPSAVPTAGDVRSARRFAAIFFFAFYLLTLLASRSADYLLQDPDIYWHVAVGGDIWRTGAFPHLDAYSFTFEGHPWIATQWLGELLFLGAYNLAGWRGVALLTACAIALTYSLLFFILSRQMRITIAAGIATAAYTFSLGHFSARPQVLADPLLVLWVAGLVEAVENRATPTWLLVPLVTLWANLHGSFTFGLAIALAFAAEAVFRGGTAVRRQAIWRWSVFLAAVLGAACITPYGYRPLLVPLQVFGGNEAISHIGEWRPVTLETPGVNEITLYGLLYLALGFGLKLPTWRLLMTLAITYLMFAHIRFASLFATLVPILLATPITRQFAFLDLNAQLDSQPEFFRVMSRISRVASQPLCAIVALGVLLFGRYGPTLSPRSSITPAAAVDYMVSKSLSEQRLYNEYNFGGYLISRNIKTFIDGRTDQLFLGGFTDRLFGILEYHPRQFTHLLSEHSVTLALVVPGSMESQELDDSSDWEKIYADKIAQLFRKRG